MMEMVAKLVGSRWTTYLAMVLVGLFGMFYPEAIVKIINWGFVCIGVSGLVRAYQEGAFDEATQEATNEITALKMQVRTLKEKVLG